MITRAEGRALRERLTRLGELLEAALVRHNATVNLTVTNISFDVQAVGLAIRGEGEVDEALDAQGRQDLEGYRQQYCD